MYQRQQFYSSKHHGDALGGRNVSKDAPKSSSVAGKKADSKTVRIMANGDLCTDGLLYECPKADGSRDFSENFTYVQGLAPAGDLDRRF